MLDKFKKYTHIIYKITNTHNKKSYIGQTIYSFNKRYRNGKWWKYTNNRYLKDSVNKYGIKNFSVEILEHSKSLEELNFLEEKYANLYNCYAPNGYNLTQCGKNKIPHEFSVNLKSKDIILNNPKGEDIQIKNIRKFCRENKLDLRSLYRVINGEFNSHKGWTLQGNTFKLLKNKRNYIFVDEKGVEYNIFGLIDFCKKRNLNYYSMRDMLNGKIKTSQGYALLMKNFSQKRKKYSITLQKNNNFITLKSIKKESIQYGLHPKYIYDLISGKIKSYLGWTIKELKLK